MKMVEYAPSIWIVSDEKKETIANAFIRFQEYYENPVFKGKKGFTVQDIETWWASKDPTESYYSYWSGFNIPGWVMLDIVKSSTYYPLSTLELDLIALFEDIPSLELGKGVILGIGDDTDDVFDHELAHAMFATDMYYKSQQIRNVYELPQDVYDSLFKDLLELGYHQSVVIDEIQAYLSTYIDSLPSVFTCFQRKDMSQILEHAMSFSCTFRNSSNRIRKCN